MITSKREPRQGWPLIPGGLVVGEELHTKSLVPCPDQLGQIQSPTSSEVSKASSRTNVLGPESRSHRSFWQGISRPDSCPVP